MIDPPLERLLVDLASIPPPAESEIQTWGSGQLVFVSSVMGSMMDERKACAQAVAAVGAVPLLFENFGGMDDDPEDAYLGQVASADIYLGVLGRRYGTPLKSGYSATQAEYDEAVRKGLRISVWSTDSVLDGRQRDFLEEVRVFHTTGTYSSPEDLGKRAENRLRTMAAEAICPWVKVGNTVFRAMSVEDDGQQVTVKARIRDGSVAASLEGRRPASSYGRNSETRITWQGGTTPVRIAAVTTEVTSSQSRTLTIVGNRVAENRSNQLDMGFDGRTPEDLTELAMRIALLGEPNPLGTMSFLVTGVNPLPSLAELRLSEDSFEQIARLMITEELIGLRGADHITQFRLGPQHLGRRRLRLAWLPIRRYVNQDPVERIIEGDAA